MPIFFNTNVRAVGTLIPTRKSYTQAFDPVNGYLFGEVYEGIDEVLMANLQNSFAANGVASTLEFSASKASLHTTDATQQYVIDSWELLGNAERRDLFTHPKVMASIYAIAPFGSPILSAGTNLPAGWGVQDNVGYIMQVIRSLLAGNTASAIAFSGISNQEDKNFSPLAPWPFPAASIVGSTPTTDGIVQRMYGVHLLGTDEYENDAYAGGYVLRHTSNISNRASLTYADLRVGEIYSTAELITEITTGWAFNCPARLVNKINLIQLIAPVIQAGYFWGWLKGRSNETTAAHNRINITVDYTLEQWQSDIYTPFP